MAQPTIAIIGASADRAKFSNKAIRAYLKAGYTVYPVHPTATTIEGLTVYPNVAALPVSQLDRASLYLPPAIGVTVLPDLAKLQIGELYLNPGADGPEVIAKAQELGLNALQACSLIAAGFHDDPDA
ncbi:CoA-binding protein [Tuwongella immobilis]|uniref:CoA-binding domain-containing protein n=1 Tax=Tuwongella immobilis TaxID=692036 RepID=A0A6C2YVC2_9BACT|nr:CoA-binding protein [Tuwongella immobilis]VIP05560.1 -binding protein : Uncharacterized protein OS=Planctomyces maris DSM 8797 GN=PM8797T_00025 PE=4 SV=1: CoA_binding_2 [Tuwongella immobilis]VTS08476.1 -binding protein : Uncharacterized protein OS=Planctomyces maris DSM 8797 GN=PM8797T_00025 PE=4 SV=1: CoA_binding_2 [Tuwongella immobilis]